VEAATIATISFWIRPFAALGAGLLADYTKPSISIIISFGLLLLGSAVIALGYLEPGMDVMIILTIAATSAGIYALRGVYFALFQEAKIPLAYTGMAVGIVSFVGYTPDIFMGPLMGYLLDSNPGTLGHQHVFALLGGFSALGLITVLVFRTLIQNRKQKIL
jgi:MFS family permease